MWTKPLLKESLEVGAIQIQEKEQWAISVPGSTRPILMFQSSDQHIWQKITIFGWYWILPPQATATSRPRTAVDCFGLEVTLIIIPRVFTMTWIDVICPLFVRQLFDMSARPKGKVLLRAKSLVEPDVQNPFSYRLQLTAWDKVKVSYWDWICSSFETLSLLLISQRSLKQWECEKCLNIRRNKPSIFKLCCGIVYATTSSAVLK